MKVLLVHNFYRFRGGEDRHVEVQIDVLRRRGHEVILYSRDSRELDSASWRKKLLAAWETPYSRTTYREVRKLVEAERPDVAHVHNLLPLISPSAIRALADAGVPVVQTHHSYRLICPSGLLYTRGAICERCTGGSFRPAVYHRCIQGRVAPSLLYAATLGLHHATGTHVEGIDLHVCPSETLRRRIATSLPAGSQVEVLPNFLPDREAQPGPSLRQYVVFLGRISQEKGLEVLLEAMRALPNVGVEVIGDGPLRPALEDSLDPGLRGRVRFRGDVADESRFDILDGALALVVPSVCLENLPYSVIESFRAGVPVLASRLGGLEEAVREGENGLLFHPGDPRALARVIQRLLSDPSLGARLRQGARRSYLERYSLEQGYERLMGHYRLLVGERGVASLPQREAFTLLGSRIRPVTCEEAVGQIMQSARAGRGEHVCLANVHTVTLGMKDRTLRTATNRALLALADGRPLVWAARLKGVRHPEQVRGVDLMRATCEAAAREGLAVYFYGGAPGVPELVARTLAEECPGLVVAGWESPPFRSQAPDEVAASIEKIRNSGARILWVALGAPKQEAWMVTHREALPGVVMIGVGAAFDFQTGAFQEAPRWMQHSGLEWMQRLFHDPVRLWRRYLCANTLFLFHGMLELVGVRLFGGDSPSAEIGQIPGGETPGRTR